MHKVLKYVIEKQGTEEGVRGRERLKRIEVLNDSGAEVDSYSSEEKIEDAEKNVLLRRKRYIKDL